MCGLFEPDERLPPRSFERAEVPLDEVSRSVVIVSSLQEERRNFDAGNLCLEVDRLHLVEVQRVEREDIPCDEAQKID